jgi:hypothetical protein
MLFFFENMQLFFFKVEHDLLHTVQSRPVVKLLEKAISLVNEDPKSAMSVTLSMMETPTSSPTSHRKAFGGLDGGKDAPKVMFYNVINLLSKMNDYEKSLDLQFLFAYIVLFLLLCCCLNSVVCICINAKCFKASFC